LRCASIGSLDRGQRKPAIFNDLKSARSRRDQEREMANKLTTAGKSIGRRSVLQAGAAALAATEAQP
jgi:hypothetical protein